VTMNGSEAAAAVFGLASAASWGGGDFSGGLAARRANALSVAPVSRVTGIAVQIALAVMYAEHPPSASTLAWSVAAGCSGALGLAALYRSLAVGVMGVNSPLTAALAAAFPVAVGTLSEGVPTTIRLVGFALALAGVWRLSRPDRVEARPEGLGLAALAGLGFGGFYVMIAQAQPPAEFWPLAASTATSFVILLGIASVTRRPLLPPGRALPIAFLAGMLDAGGNVFYLLAAHAGRFDVAAILGSLYPAATVLLARLILKERVTPGQAAGIVAVIAAIPLIAG
jgi:drug/metabolite transporter (DMT)-like permease